MRDNKNLRDYIRRTAMLLSVLFVTAATAWGQTASKYHVEKIVGSQPQGWLKTMMQRQHDGLTGHPEALSYPYNTCLWAGEISRPDETYGENWWRYEQTAYYTDGLLRLGYELGDDAMVAKAMEGIEYTLAHPNEKGVLGNKTLKGITWPMSVFFRAMQAKYEHDGDERIPAALERHFLNFKVDDLTGGIVGGRNIMSIEGILWTYGKTGNPALLQLAEDAWGDVFFTDQPNNRIYRWDCESGKITLFTDQSGRSNGMYFDAQGNLIACADMDNQLWSFDMEGHSTILITDYREKLLNGPNDVWISKDEGYYLTDPYFRRDYWTRSPERQQPVEGLYYLAPGSKQLIMLDSTLNQPNGIVGTPDGKHLYVAEAKANRILKYDILPNGNLTNRQVFANMGSDGMTIDDRENVYLTGNGVTVFDKDGQKIAHFPIPEDWTANVCFGGKERNILFITASKSVYTLKMLVHGVK